MTTRERTPNDKPKGGRLVHHGRRITLITLVTAATFVAGGWAAYAMPFRTPVAATGQASAAPQATPTLPPTSSPTTDPTIEPTAAPTPGPTVVPTPTPVPTVAPTLQPPTPQTVFTIGVPIIRQTRVLNCETAALQMGLQTYGYYYSQDALFARENPDLRPPVMGANHRVLRWGDPYTNFVGDVNGSDWTPTGYGVYYPVILRIARDIGLTNAYGGEGMAPSTIYNALKTGHAVEVWVETNWTRPGVDTWTAWDGRKVRYSYAEHAVTLSGVSPTQVRVNDSLHGTQYWISKAIFETSWADFNNMAVIF